MRYQLSRFAIELNELTPGLKSKLPPTDCRLRPDQAALEHGKFDLVRSCPSAVVQYIYTDELFSHSLWPVNITV